jgi:hypothetical protein
VSALTLDFEWIDPADAKGPELRATWARLEIRLEEEPITRLIDLGSRSVRSSLFLPLYPLAEWLATHWWFLFHEIETLGRSTSDHYGERHNIRHGAEGFALPSLTVQPLGEQIRLDWRPVRLSAQNVEFTASGSRHVPASELRQSFSDLISAVVKRLQEQDVEDTLLDREWRNIQAIDAEEESFCEAVAALGIDPYTLEECEQQQILSVSELLPPSLLRDFFAAADPPSLPAQARQVLEALEHSRRNRANLESLKALRGELAARGLPKGSPWQQGYRFAHELRQRLHLNGTTLGSLPALGKALGIEGPDLDAAIIKIAELPTSLDALVAINSHESPGFAVPELRREEAVRFAFCRALFEYLTTPENQSLLVTRARSERQKRNRAFAAEFLVPADLLREALPGHVVGDEELDDLAATFGVSPNVIRHQIENHCLASPLSD